MMYKIPVYNEEGKIVPLEIEAEDIFEAIEIVSEQGVYFIADYISVCWYNRENIN